MDENTAITFQGVEAEKVGFIDIFIPIYRYPGNNYWGCGNTYAARHEAMDFIRNLQGIADAKVLHHTERFIPLGKELQ